jgi:hypothetical protein
VTWTGPGNLVTEAGAIIINRADATFEIRNDQCLCTPAGRPFRGRVTNEGQLTKTASAGTTTFDDLSNSGTVSLDTGVLQVVYRGSSSGTFDAAGGTTLLLSSHRLSDGALFTGSGLVRMGVVSLCGAVTADRVEITSVVTGRCGAQSILTVRHWARSESASFFFSSLRIEPEATFEINGLRLFRSNLYNFGTAILPTGGISADDGSWVSNGVGATMHVQADGCFCMGDGFVSFSNSGTIVKTGAGTLHIIPGRRDTFSNAGLIDLREGTLRIGRAQSSGTIHMGPGVTLGVAAPGPPPRVAPAPGPFEFTGSITGPGNVVVLAEARWTSGTFEGGHLTVPAGSSLEIAGAQPKALVANTLTNLGTTTWSGGQINADQASAIENGLAANFKIQTDACLCGAGAVQNNGGFVTKSMTSGTTRFETLLHTTGGHLDVETGTVELAGGGQTSGEFLVRPGAALVWSGGTSILKNGSSVNGGGAARIAGASVLLEGTVGIPQVELQRGTLAALGSGTLQGNLTNAGGWLVPGGIGTLRITGNYVQAAGGTLGIGLGGSPACSAFDQLDVTGSAALGGTLSVNRADNCTPSAGQRFPILTFGSRTGDFVRTEGLGSTLRREDTPTSISLVGSP